MMQEDKAYIDQSETGRRDVMGSNLALDVPQNEDYASKDIQAQIHRIEDPEYAHAKKTYMRKLDLIICPMISLL